MPGLSPISLLLLIGGVLSATLVLAGILALLLPWLTREVQAAYGQAPAPARPAVAPVGEAPAAPAAPSQRIGPWPFVISGLALLVVLAVIFYPMPQPRGSTPAAPTEGSAPISAPATNPTPAAVALKGDAEKGKELFLGTCASCHGPDAKGLPGLGKDLTTSAFVRQQTDVQLLEFIKKGRPATDPANTTGVDMPPKGGNPALTDQDLVDIIAFIRTFNPHQP
jgi:disulfide bond formation protein DsbB